jgi:hypothetical protein
MIDKYIIAYETFWPFCVQMQWYNGKPATAASPHMDLRHAMYLLRFFLEFIQCDLFQLGDFWKLKEILNLEIYGNILSNFHNEFKTPTKFCLCSSISIMFANQIYSYPTYNPIHHEID